MTDFDARAAARFGRQVSQWYTGAYVTAMIDLGHRTGLFEAAAEGPATSHELADRAGLQERYVREWLGAVASAGIVTYESSSGRYTLPSEHATSLAGDGPYNVAATSQLATHLIPFIGPVATAFREGGGVPYDRYRPEFTGVMDSLNRPLFDSALVQELVPMVDGLSDRLSSGTRVGDVGCGTGHSTNVLARAFPASTFVGFDLADDALEMGRAEARELGLGNVSFEKVDAVALPSDPPLGVAFAFDAIHDQVDPVEVLRRIHDALEPGGLFVMFDVRASSDLERNLDNPFATMLYAVSTLHCMTVSLAHGGAGLGTVWGEELATEMLTEAGFVDLEVHEVPDDPLDSLYVARKP